MMFVKFKSPITINILEHFNRTAHFFSFKLIIEGTTENVSKFKMPLMATYIKMFCVNEQKCIFEHHRKIKRMKISL